MEGSRMRHHAGEDSGLDHDIGKDFSRSDDARSRRDPRL